MRGPLLPVRWGGDLQSLARKNLGFDAENPMVKTEISRILARGPLAKGARANAELGGVLDYKETSVEALLTDAIPVTVGESSPAAPGPELGERSVAVGAVGFRSSPARLALLGLALVTLTGGLWIWRRRRLT